MTLQVCLDSLLIRGLDDWIQAAEVASVARTTGGAESEEAVRDLSLRLIRALLEAGLVAIGSVKEQIGFVAWGIPIDDAMSRIETEWSTRPTGPGLGEICWLNLTEDGQFQARVVWSRRGGENS